MTTNNALNCGITPILLSKQTASNSATISFSSFVNSLYKTYLLLFRDISPVTNNVALHMLVSTDNGSTYLSSNYEYVFNFNTSGASNGVVGGSGGASAFFVVCDALSNVTADAMSGEIQFFDMNTTNSMKYFGNTIYYAQFGKSDMEITSGLQNSTSPVNAIQLLMSSGNISSGTFSLFGIIEQ